MAPKSLQIGHIRSLMGFASSHAVPALQCCGGFAWFQMAGLPLPPRALWRAANVP
jgi:hypothetical protein